MKLLIGMLVAFSFSFAWAQPEQVSTDLVVDSVGALSKISLDTWMHGLYQKNSGSVAAEQIQSKVGSIVAQHQGYAPTYQSLLQLQAQTDVQTIEVLQAWADALLNARARNRGNQLVTAMLEFMLEDVLVVGYEKFPAQMQEYSKQLKAPEARWSADAQKLRGIDIIGGDVLISKYTGSGSSSFIAMAMARQSFFSHSTPVYIGSDKRLLSPEAFIEDGVKLRDLTQDYVTDSKTRLFVYRSLKNVAEAQKGLQSLVDEMRQRQSDPATQAAFPYNFRMDPRIESAYFCPQTVMDSFRRGGVGYDSEANPYPAKQWRGFTGANKQVFGNFLGFSDHKFPAPGDIEFNPNFELAGVYFDVKKLAQERMEMAAIDVLLQLVERNDDKVRAVLKPFDRFGDQPITTEQLQALQRLPLPAQIQSKVLAQIPANISIKQLVFFTYINQEFTPAVRSALQMQAAEMQRAQGRQPGLGELRLMASNAVAQQLAKMRDLVQQIAQQL